MAWKYRRGIVTPLFLMWKKKRGDSSEVFVENPDSIQTPSIQEFILNSQTRTVKFRQHIQQLTHIEFQLLEHLLPHHNYLISRQDLLQAVWREEVMVGSRTVDSHIMRLRRKLKTFEPQPCVIETVWGLGYRLRWILQY